MPFLIVCGGTKIWTRTQSCEFAGHLDKLPPVPLRSVNVISLHHALLFQCPTLLCLIRLPLSRVSVLFERILTPLRG